MLIDIEEVPGLYLIPDLFSDIENDKYMEIMNTLEKQNVCNQIHKAFEFGWKFLPISPKTKNDFLGEFPFWLLKIWNKVSDSLEQTNFPIKYPDHVLLNKYEPGEGCLPHTDDIKFWDNWVIGVSFGSGSIARFKGKYNKIYDLYLPIGSVYIMMNEARYEFTHEILAQKIDEYYGERIERKQRISLTFRTIHENYLSKKIKDVAYFNL